MSREWHTFAPIFNDASRILILGSFPSAASRQNGFYYGHPRNRFWELIARILGQTPPDTIDAKRAMLLQNQIALWDVCASCEVEGSADSSIADVVPNDIPRMLENTCIERIYTNGATAHKLFTRHFPEYQAIRLPSTSPANAAYSIDRLYLEWRQILRGEADFNA